ncbi:tetratricopeptide repeat protein [Streptacidiphilus monticola]
MHTGLAQAARRLLRLIALAPGGLVDARTASALLGTPVEAAEGLLDVLAAHELTVRQGPHHRLPGWARPVVAALAAAERPAEVELARARLLEREIRLLGAAVHRLGGGPPPEPLPAPLRLHSAQQAWDWLDGELPVLQAATRVEGLDGAVLRLATLLVRALPLWAGGAADLGPQLYRLHDRVRELACRTRQPQREAAALLNLGDLHARAGEHERALERYRAALGPAKAAEDQLAVGRILEAAAGAYRASGDLVRAVDWYGRALSLRRKRGERAEEARLLERLAATHCAQGRQAEAVREYRSAAGARRKLGDEAGLVGTLLGLARAQEPQGAEAVLKTLREALETARRLRDGRQGPCCCGWPRCWSRPATPRAPGSPGTRPGPWARPGARRRARSVAGPRCPRPGAAAPLRLNDRIDRFAWE